MIYLLLFYFFSERLRPAKSPFDEIDMKKIDIKKQKNEVSRRIFKKNPHLITWIKTFIKDHSTVKYIFNLQRRVPFLGTTDNIFRVSTATLGENDLTPVSAKTFKPASSAENSDMRSASIKIDGNIEDRSVLWIRVWKSKIKIFSLKKGSFYLQNDWHFLRRLHGSTVRPFNHFVFHLTNRN